MQPQFDSLDDDTGLEVVDPIEGKRFVFYTPEEVTPTEASTDEFYYPVSSACRITASELRLPRSVVTTVRDGYDGSYLEKVDVPSTGEFTKGYYLIDIDASIKIYLRTDAGFEITNRGKRSVIDFDSLAELSVGARSHHCSPSETITVPDDPMALMDAVSVFGSVLKTTSCERSWPTLRGHPPRLERGDRLSIPDSISMPDTGVTIHVPPCYEYVYPVAPLAHYVGAKVRSGDPPRLTTENGFIHRFDTERGVVEEIIRVLKQVFFFDCVVRTEGYDQSELHQRTMVEDRAEVEFNFSALYDASLPDQIERYLSVPFEAVEDIVPTWDRSVHLRPDADGLDLLPYVVNDLSLVRPEVPRESTKWSPNQRRRQQAISTFKRNESSNNERSGAEGDRRDDEQTRRSHRILGSEQYVPLPEVDAVEQAWVGGETPERGSKLIAEAFERQQTGSEDSTFRVIVVCNDTEMVKEKEKALERYGRYDVISADVNFHTNVSTAKFRQLLAKETDLFHYIGHINREGFECSDGVFDAEALNSTGASAVLLNACQSYEQGVTLVECGANAVVVSLGDVENGGAVAVGEKFAGLLNYGYTVGAALEVVIEHTFIGRQYIVVGDPGTSVAQIRSSVPALFHLTTNDNGTLDVSHQMYTNRQTQVQMGSVAVSYLVDQGTHYLPPTTIEGTDIKRSAVESELLDTAPVIEDGEFTWH
ncbi:CHAT domain-containing protein [Halorussus halophilus]|uniref:hypothetical protein n=1 Tax=Halorussus halophilus TaxID=2650975 RepID=UPI001301510B|nr:hypothetical protein [Halorussus halophilus]